MEHDIEIPDFLPVMTLSDVVFFPKAILPLYIFEERYRRMLADVLAGNRLFVVACRDHRQLTADPDSEIPAPVATVGVVRASHQNPDGTSNLVLQGVARVDVRGFESHAPYPLIRVVPMPEASDAESDDTGKLHQRLRNLLHRHKFLTSEIPEEFADFLLSIEAHETFIDMTAYALCDRSEVKQSILASASVAERCNLLLRFLNGRVRQRQLFKTLQGTTPDESIGLN